MIIRPITQQLHHFRPSSLIYHVSVKYGSSSSTPSKTSDPKKDPKQALVRPPPPGDASFGVGSKEAAGGKDSGGKDAPCPAPCPDPPTTTKSCPPPSESPVPPAPPSPTPGPCDDENDVNFYPGITKSLILLNRPKQMNALNHCMARKILYMLQKWRCEKSLVVLKGYGDPFCAGGDVVAIARDCTGQSGKNFFRDEYKLNASIGSLKIPYVSLYNGVVMGGGVGLSIHGKFRVATECSLFAMPETQIGFFPDVGVSHFLSRMPNNLGQFLGLTGYRLRGYDLIHTGIATHYCSANKLGDLEKELLSEDSKKCVDEVIQHYHNESVKGLCGGQTPVFTLEQNMPIIMSCFCGDCVEVILRKLENDPCPLSKELLEIMRKSCPISLKVTHKLISEACNLDLNEVLNVDYRVASRFMEGRDFYEGVRAMLIDKDKNPRWSHASVCEVCMEEVLCYFRPLPPEEELCLPQSMDTL